MASKENVLMKGCRARLLTAEGEFEGILQNFDVQLGLISMKKVHCLRTQKIFPNSINFMKDEIKKLTVLSEPQTKAARNPTKDVTQQRTSCLSGNVVQEGTRSSSGNMAQQDSKVLHSSKSDNHLSYSYLETSANRSPKTQASNNNVKTTTSFKVPLGTEQALLGGIPTPLCEVNGGDAFSDEVFENGMADCLLLDQLSEELYLAAEKTMSSTVIGLAMEGNNLGRNGQLAWIMISVKSHVFLFDVLALGEEKVISILKSTFENERILKVIHDSRAISDLLFHRHQIRVVNVFDTQVASVMLFRKNNGYLPQMVDSLVVCILEHLNLPDEDIYTQKVLLKKFKGSPEVWSIRPATDNVLLAAVFIVRHLPQLRLRLIEKMLSDFVDGVDIYLGLFRDAQEAMLAKLQNQNHMLPVEFKDLRQNAEASRNKLAELYLRQPGARGRWTTVDKFTAEESETFVKNTSEDSKVKIEESKAILSSDRKPDESVCTSTGADKTCSEDKLTLKEAVRRQAAISPNSDGFVLIAAGNEPTKIAEIKRKRKSNSGIQLNINSNYENGKTGTSGTPEKSSVMKSTSRRVVPMFDDLTSDPQKDSRVIHIGHFTSDDFDSHGSTTDGSSSDSNGRSLHVQSSKCQELPVHVGSSGIVTSTSYVTSTGTVTGISSSAAVCDNKPISFDVPFDVCARQPLQSASSATVGHRTVALSQNGVLPKSRQAPVGRGSYVLQLLGYHASTRPGVHQEETDNCPIRR